MIRRIIGFSLYYGLGVGSAVLAMVTMLPPLQLGDGVQPDLDGGAQHALYVEGSASRPALAAATATSHCPYLAAVAVGSRCPYLAAVTATTSGCPYLAAVAGRSGGCPYLLSVGRGAGCPFLGGRRGADGERAPRTPRPHGPDGVTPKAIQPDVDWMPEGTVLARLDKPDSGPTVRDRI